MTSNGGDSDKVDEGTENAVRSGGTKVREQGEEEDVEKNGEGEEGIEGGEIIDDAFFENHFEDAEAEEREIEERERQREALEAQARGGLGNGGRPGQGGNGAQIDPQRSKEEAEKEHDISNEMTALCLSLETELVAGFTADKSSLTRIAKSLRGILATLTCRENKVSAVTYGGQSGSRRVAELTLLNPHTSFVTSCLLPLWSQALRTITDSHRPLFLEQITKGFFYIAQQPDQFWVASHSKSALQKYLTNLQTYKEALTAKEDFWEGLSYLATYNRAIVANNGQYVCNRASLIPHSKPRA